MAEVRVESLLKICGHSLKDRFEVMTMHFFIAQPDDLEGQVGAVAMTEGSLIHARDICVEGNDIALKNIGNERIGSSFSPCAEDENEYVFPQGVQLNEWQRKALPFILNQGEISRSEYQRVVGNGLPTRTAAYDLQDLARRGIVARTGRGPSTRYRLVRDQEQADPKAKA